MRAEAPATYAAPPPASGRLADVAVVGLGYVGITLAVALADAGLTVLGYDINADVTAAVGGGTLPIHETGLEERLRELLGEQLAIVDELPERLPPDIVVTVGTPLSGEQRTPDITAVRAAAAAIATRIDDDTLVVQRSTVPVGVCRDVVLPILAEHCAAPLLAYCPERTIQGMALEELRALPQVVSGADARALARASRLFERLTPRVVPVSSLETAELIKLVCNAHTDVLYGFGNEVAVMSEALGLDASEVIASANLDYPRPDLARPGFVGGSCLVKDAYFLIHSLRGRGEPPGIVAAARRLNERVVEHVADRVLEKLRALRGDDPSSCVLALCGIAYKGRPETDDVRGGAAQRLAPMLAGSVAELRGHDFVVSPDDVAALGLDAAASLGDALDGADAAMILNDHAGYRDGDLHAAVDRMRRPAVVFDVWGIGEAALSPAPDGVTYMRFGCG